MEANILAIGQGLCSVMCRATCSDKLKDDLLKSSCYSFSIGLCLSGKGGLQALNENLPVSRCRCTEVNDSSKSFVWP